ncbi:hypothetical protein [Sinorhizobium meliloti]|uniref:hypothetical protein n=1 Tax=Rhizobium meliloti TaxID=382 RepID=UPI003F141E52
MSTDPPANEQVASIARSLRCFIETARDLIRYEIAAIAAAISGGTVIWFKAAKSAAVTIAAFAAYGSVRLKIFLAALRKDDSSP